MELFISWSGVQSKKIAKSIHTWLPSVLQAVKPYYSKDDIAKGKRWGNELGTQLNNSEFGLIILTKENIEAPWILFEAGALSKNLDISRVCPILFGIKETDVKGPLAEFQFTKFNREDCFKLVTDLNELLEDRSLDTKVIEKVFDKMWDDFKNEVDETLNSTVGDSDNIRSERELIEEILSIVRKSHYRNLFKGDDFIEKHFRNNVVSFDDKTNYIFFWDKSDKVYKIPLSGLHSTGEILDWIFQIYAKGWSTPQHIYEFLNCIEELSEHIFGTNAQGIVCPSGMHRSINWLEKKVKDV